MKASLTVRANLSKQVSAILKGYPKPEAGTWGFEGTPEPICSIWPPERASKGFQIPLDDWMLETFVAYTVSYMPGIMNPDLSIYLMDILSPELGRPYLVSERSLQGQA